MRMIKKTSEKTKFKLKKRNIYGVAFLMLIFVFAGTFLDMLMSRYSTFGMVSRALPALSRAEKYTNSDQNIEVTSNNINNKNNTNNTNIKTQEIKFETVELEEGIRDEIRIELLSTKSQSINLRGDKPKILIYSTHATEAYTPTEKMPYIKTDDWRTADNTKNITGVAEELAKELSEKYNLSVIHDTTNYEPPVLGTSYTRSILGMQDFLAKYPTIDLFIDVHRDAYEPTANLPRDFVTIDKTQVARLMFVVGTGEGKTGVGFDKKPNYKQNYAMALAIQEKLSEFDPKLARPIRIKDGRYNQHIPGRAILVEVGNNQNTLEEALASIPYLAKAISQVAGEK